MSPQEIKEQFNESRWNIIFMMSYRCDMACPHCLYNCGPWRSGRPIPYKDTLNIIDQISENSVESGGCFRNGFCVTGGEASILYKNDPDYIGNMIRHGLRNDMIIELKTNAMVVQQPYYEAFKKDMCIFNDAQDKFSIHLSIDRFHKDTVQNNSKLIQDLGPTGTRFLITSFAGHHDVVKNVAETVGLPQYFRNSMISGDVLIEIGDYPVKNAISMIQAGRALKNKITEPTSYLYRDTGIEYYCPSLVIKNNGLVSLADNFKDDRISTELRNGNKKVKSLLTIINELEQKLIQRSLQSSKVIQMA